MVTTAIGMIASQTVTAAPVTYTSFTWTGASSTLWTASANWSPNTSYPSSETRIANFSNAAPDNQPYFTGSVGTVLGIGQIYLTGSVGDTTVTGDRTIQVSGTHADTADPYEGGVLIDAGVTGKLTIANSSFKIARSTSWINNSGSLFTVSAPVNLNALSLTVKGSGDTLLSGGINVASGSLTKDGDGTLTLSATNIHTGATTISSGKLLVNGGLSNSASALVTANGGTLGGTGTIERKTTINSSATLAPGALDTTAEDLTFTRTLTLSGTTSFDLISPSSYDQIVMNAINGQTAAERKLIFGGTLKVQDRGVAFANGQVFNLFDWNQYTDADDASFASFDLPTLPSGLSWEMYGAQPFDYTTGTISIVPEPAFIGAFGLLAIGLTRTRRRRV